MEQRKGDSRIYIITLLFLSCIVSGGILLGLYLLLSDPNPLFLQAGMVFVCVPWLFWFLAYLYSCILKPCTVSLSNSVANFDPEKGHDKDKNIKNNKNNDNVHEKSTSDSDLVDAPSPMEVEKHVQFGNVVALGDEQGGNEEDEDRNEGSSNHLIQDHMRIENQESGRLNSRS